MEHDLFTFRGIRIDDTEIGSLVIPLDFSYLKVPLPDVGPDYAEAWVVHHPPVFICQGLVFTVQPGNLVTKQDTHISVTI